LIVTTFPAFPESVVTLPESLVTIPESHLKVAGILLANQAKLPAF